MKFKHLKEVDETYFEHMRFALLMACRMAWGAFCIGVHALIPSLFVTTGSVIISKCYRIVASKFPDKSIDTASKKE